MSHLGFIDGGPAGAAAPAGQASRIVGVMIRGLEHLGYRHFAGVLLSQACGLGHESCPEVDALPQARPLRLHTAWRRCCVRSGPCFLSERAREALNRPAACARLLSGLWLLDISRIGSLIEITD